MKYTFIGILALVLCAAFLPFNALAAPGDAVLLLLESGEINAYIEQSLAVVGGTLYILRPEEGLYSYHVGDETPVMLLDLKKYDAAGTEKTEADDLSLSLKSYQQMSAPAYSQAADEEKDGQPELELVQLQHIVGGGDKLYALDDTCEQLWALNEEKGVFEPALNLNTSAIKSGPEDSRWIDTFNHRIIDGSLYMLVRDYDTYMPTLKKFDLSTGAATDIKIDSIYDYAPYKDGKLFVGLGEWKMDEIGILDSETGKYERKMDIDTYGYYGLQYDSETDAHFMYRSGEILRSIAFGAWETAAFIPVSNYMNLPCVLLPSGYFAVCLPDSVHIRSTDPQYLPERPLKLNGIQWEDLTRMFAKANPDVPIAYSDAYFMNMEELAASMAGSDASDIYTIYSGNMDLGGFYRKGYLADLSGNRAIAETVNKMYPNIRETLTFDGKIVALPYYMYVNSFGVNLKTLEEIGLTLDDAPKTYFELLEFIERWINEYSAEYPDLKIFEYCENLNHQLMYAILNAQMTFCGAQGEPLTFDTPVMRKLLAKLESIDFTPLSESVSFEDENDVQRQWEVASSDDSAPLFIIFDEITIDRYSNEIDRKFEPTPLALDEGMPALLDAEVRWLVINQKSVDNEEAMRFMQYCAENMYQMTRVNTMPDENEPIEIPNSVQIFKEYQEHLNKLNILLEMADEGTKPFIETDIQSFMRMMDNEWMWRWIASSDYIARYRSLYDYVTVTKPNLLFSRYSEEITTLISRFNERQIKSDQFIMELSRKLYMMQMEG